MSTWTRFEKEARGDSEMCSSNKHKLKPKRQPLIETSGLTLDHLLFNSYYNMLFHHNYNYWVTLRTLTDHLEGNENLSHLNTN